MRIRNLFLNGTRLFIASLSLSGFAQLPVANFSISPNPACSGSANVVQITDLSTNSPTSWSYTLNMGPMGPLISTVQNPTIAYNQPGTHTITLMVTNAYGSSSPVTQTVLVLASPNALINPTTLSTCIGGNPQTINVFTGPGATDTFSWSNGATTTSVSVSPSVTTIYSCVITATNGCYIVRAATVTVAQPTLNITSIPASICPGNSCTLIATGQGPGPSTYSWSTGASTRTISTNIPMVYTASYTNSNGCMGSFSYNLGTSTTLSLTAHADPSVVCIGGSSHLAVIGASSYTWNTGSTIATATVTPNTSTTYTVNGQFATCSGVATVMVNVSLNPTITISGSPSAICAGDSATLSANGATTYTWSQGGGNSQSISVSPSITTTYLVGGSNPGCPVKMANIVMNVSPHPVIMVTSSSSLVCAGEAVALAANGANTYTWSGGGSNAVLLVTPTITTTYSVTGASINNCYGTTAFTQSVSACTGINTINETNNSLELFPNPNNGNFSVRTSSAMNLSILDQTGRVIRSLSTNDTGTGSINITGLADGIYFVIGQNANGFLKQKVVITR
jgi:hypothetical protein